MIAYPAGDIRPFVMYCVNRKPSSSLLIESTDSMIIYNYIYLSVDNLAPGGPPTSTNITGSLKFYPITSPPIHKKTGSIKLCTTKLFGYYFLLHGEWVCGLIETG